MYPGKARRYFAFPFLIGKLRKSLKNGKILGVKGKIK
jgi:hypothetical protein